MKKESSIKALAVAGVFAAFTAVLSQISVPLPSGVPVTFQTFAIALCGYSLGKKYSLFSVAAYLVIGLFGIPVFANFTGGPGVFTSYAGGFLYGFLPMALFCGAGASVRSGWIALVLGIPALICCHLCGVLWFAYITNTPFLDSVLLVSAPYAVKDLVSVCAAWFLGRKMNHLLNEKMNIKLV